MKTKGNRIPVIGANMNVYDCNAMRIHVGDKLEWQETAGRYGQTRKGSGTVTAAELSWGCIVTDQGNVRTHWEMRPGDGPEGLYCRHENHDPDHAHKTWAKIVS